MARKRLNPWFSLPFERLLDTRLCDLNLRLQGSPVQRSIHELHDELAIRGLGHVRPHCWLSDEWFSPDGIPGIAVPFYLAHPRLMKLEKQQMLEVEGGNRAWCLKILRHEAGHAIETAFGLHRRAKWRELFGSNAAPYPTSYKPKPDSRSFVLHLSGWYAQAHPSEDFAETFAVWLKPGSRWRQQYAGWAAMRKLEYVDELMREIAGKMPRVRNKQTWEPIEELTLTLREHYNKRKLFYAKARPAFFDRDLRRLFSESPRFARRETAASFIRRLCPELRDKISHWTGAHAYTIDQVLRDMIDRCKELKLRLALPERVARNEATIMVTVQTMNFVLGGHQPLAL